MLWSRGLRVLDQDPEEPGMNPYSAMKACWDTVNESSILSLTNLTGLL